MKKIMAGVLGFLMVGMIAVEADAASRVSSSRSSFSSSRSSYSAPKSSYTAPKQQAGTSSNPGLKALGFGKPASAQTASRPAASASSNSLNLSKPQPVAKTTTTSGGWFSKKQVSSTPARKVSSPTAYRSQPRNVTVIQRNYYGGNSYGYNRGYGGNYYGGYGGYGYSNGFGSSFAGTLGGLMVYNALFNSHSTSGNASAAQIEQAKQDQRIEDKLDRVLDQQTQGVVPMAVGQQAPVKPQCFLPQDAPLMMTQSFYCEQPK